MNHIPSFNSDKPLVRISIWTIIHHDWLAAQFRLYVWLASATILLLSIASVIPLQTALYALLFSGLGTLIVVWLLIHWRKSVLLSIRDEKLKQTAHAAMLALIRSKKADTSAADGHTGPQRAWVKKKSHP
jgi:branched-subunit amino acid transport protein AzlD